jgi:hypothetical protein
MKSQDEWILAAYSFGMETGANLVFDLIDRGISGRCPTGASDAADCSEARAIERGLNRVNGSRHYSRALAEIKGVDAFAGKPRPQTL